MISQPVKIGDDTAVVIPSVILAQLGIREGDTLEIALNKDKMEIKKMVLKTNAPTYSEQPIAFQQAVLYAVVSDEQPD